MLFKKQRHLHYISSFQTPDIQSHKPRYRFTPFAI